MPLIIAKTISKAYAGSVLFENVDFSIDGGEKTALIGINGCGKSTLLSILARENESDSGEISYERGMRISYLSQNPSFNKEDSILDFILAADTPQSRALLQYEKALGKLSKESSEKNKAEFSRASEELEKHNSWDYEREVRGILESLKISEVSLRMGELSGGMLKKVALGKALISRSDVLFLDEPTNHLDAFSILWLEEYLKKDERAVLMITHDRYFLDGVCSSIHEIDGGKLYRYNGNYSYYLEKKAELENEKIREDERVSSVLRREVEWLSRGAKARSTKQKARIQRAESLMEHEYYKGGESLSIDVASRRLGNKILEIKSLRKSFGTQNVINDFSRMFNRGEKIGLAGKNGSGKTTLLNLISGRIKPDAGEIDIGDTVSFGYFDQKSESLDESMRLMEYLEESGKYAKNKADIPNPTSLAKDFLFPPNMHYTRISELSGGQKRRLYLLSILMSAPNFLLFDEPTNDLDITTLSILEDYLMSFEGCLIIVSHDRYFMDRLTDHLLIFNDGVIEETNISYSEYLTGEASKKEVVEKEKVKNTKEKVKENTEARRLSYNEQRELKSLEKEIDKLEKEKNELSKRFEEDLSPNELDKFSKRYSEIETSLEEKMLRWEALAQYA